MATVAQTQETKARTSGNWGRWIQGAAWALALICVLGLPTLFSDGASTNIGFYVLVFAASASAWNIFSGYSGYIALGHAVFFGLGQYILAILCQELHIPGGYQVFYYMPLAALITAIIAIPLGFIALRTRRHTFIVITIAFVFIFQLLAENNIFGLTNGLKGLEFPIPPWFGDFYNLPFYYIMAGILIIIVLVSTLIRHSKYGLELLAIRDDEDRALGLGVRTGFLKLSAFVISAFFVAICGAMSGYYIESVYPAAGQSTGFSPLLDVVIALMVFLGGLGTISGPLIGAVIIEYSYLYLNDTLGVTGWNLILYGAIFLGIILLLPQGIVPALGQLFARLRKVNANQHLVAGPRETPTEPTPTNITPATQAE